jgi:hypothetical protein
MTGRSDGRASRLIGGLALLEPAAKGLLRFARATACQQTLHADIFVQVRPMDALAAGDETPVGSLRGRPVRQAREPREWHRDRPAVRKISYESVVAKTNVLSQCFILIR